MSSFQENMQEFKELLKQGTVQQAYRGLMDFIMNLKTYFKNKYPNYFVSGSIYCGYMDMTYFSFTPQALKDRKLKIAVVFNYDAFRFEVWLGGYNKQTQAEYWRLFKDSGWNCDHLVPTTEGKDSILEHILVVDPDFGDLDALTRTIEENTLCFIADVEKFLSE
ncbi:MAG: hypothetical protein GYA45_12105 [Pelolinea sp.]|jgi:hypothetical protein|nr:hypothetical protein [Pelolinea sp.]